MRFMHHQLEIAQGDYDANLARVLQTLEKARREQIDIVTFPESNLTGYFDTREDAWNHSFTADDPRISRLLEQTAHFGSAFLVGFNERQGEDLYNSVLICERGRLLGIYRKAFPVRDYFAPGRQFPVYQRDGVTYGVMICADGGFIEPARIMALRGARIILAPHNNIMPPQHTLAHYELVLAEHAARASENGVYFLRGNNVTRNPQFAPPEQPIGYGDSFLMDPNGRIVARSRLYNECYLTVEIDFDGFDFHGYRFGRWRSLKSGRALREAWLAALDEAED